MRRERVVTVIGSIGPGGILIQYFGESGNVERRGEMNRFAYFW